MGKEKNGRGEGGKEKSEVVTMGRGGGELEAAGITVVAAVVVVEVARETVASAVIVEVAEDNGNKRKRRRKNMAAGVRASTGAAKTRKPSDRS